MTALAVKSRQALKPRKSLDELLANSSKVKTQLSTLSSLDKLLIVILDTSGSMNDYIENQKKINVAWSVLQDKLAKNMNGWSYGILMFKSPGWDSSESVSWLIRPTDSTGRLMSTLRPQANASTPILAALEKAWSFVSCNKVQSRIILLSDGCPTDCTDDTLLVTVGDHKNIPIDTIGIGNSRGSYNESLLRSLSNITGGVFCKADSIKLLESTIEKLSPAKRKLIGTVNG